MTSKNILTRHQSFQLFNWIEKNKAVAGHQTAELLARAATKELGFPISPSSVSQTRRDLGIETSTRGGTRQTKSSGEIASLKQGMHTIAREMVNLLKKFNEPVSAELEEMAK